MYIKGEIITQAEALRRVGLHELVEPGHEDAYVDWVGTPVPFGGGHVATFGHGPLDRPDDNDRNGKGRRYQSRMKVSQHHCHGNVLFCWGNVGGMSGKPSPFLLASSFVVCVGHMIDDDPSRTVLTCGIAC